MISRLKSNALITKKEAVFSHVFKMVSEQKINTINGVEVELLVDTVCVHGDTKNAHAILEYLYHNLESRDILIS